MIPSIDPNWITGFTDGEGCFAIVIYDRKEKKTPAVQFSFSIALADRDLDIIKKIKEFFNAGFYSVRKNKDVYNAYYKCSGPNIIKEKIIPHFNKYSLQTEKEKSYQLWKTAIGIWQSDLSKKERLLRLVEIRKKMNPKGRKKPTSWDKEKILSYFKKCPDGSVVERILGKNEAGSSILPPGS